MPPRRSDHNVILDLRAAGVRIVDIAQRVDATVSQVSGIIERARRNGDPRAKLLRDVAQDPPAFRPVDRPGVVVISVPIRDRTNDGILRRTDVSLPRLSILEGWAGVAS